MTVRIQKQKDGTKSAKLKTWMTVERRTQDYGHYSCTQCSSQKKKELAEKEGEGEDGVTTSGEDDEEKWKGEGTADDPAVRTFPGFKVTKFGLTGTRYYGPGSEQR
eukprot:183915-Rhodomonas_salina.1